VGYSGASCNTCAAGYQDNDSNGTCLPTCATAGLTCDPGTSCSDASGVATCGCAPGWAGLGCDRCADGYVLNGSNQCVLPGTGATCVAPALLDMSAAYYAWATLTGSSTGAGNETAGSCGGAGTNERVFSFTLEQPMNVMFDIGGYDAVAYIRTSCDDPATELGCSDDYGEYNNAHDVSPWLSGGLPAGTYLLFVDGFEATVNGEGNYSINYAMTCPSGLIGDGAGGCVDNPCSPNPCGANSTCAIATDLTASCDCDAGFVASGGDCVPPSPAPNNDTCTNLIPIPIGDGVINGTTAGATNNVQPSCDGSSGRDRVYVLTLTTDTFVDLQLTAATYNPLIYVHMEDDETTTSDCGVAAAEIVCRAGTAGTTTPARVLTVLPAGTYYIGVDATTNAGQGDYTLTYAIHPYPCTANACPSGQQCFADEVDFATYWSTFTCMCPGGQVDDGSGNCVESPDIVDWTILVYMNGDNDLAPYAIQDLNEMRSVATNPNVDVVVLHDDTGTNGTTGNTRLEWVGHGESQLGEFDMGDAWSLRWFGMMGVQGFPARHYALVMWDHGDGWSRASSVEPLKGFSNDFSSGTAISIADGSYDYAMYDVYRATGRPLDVVGFDACLMGMWEVANATQYYADYFVGSEETEPASGWDYDAFLASLVAEPTMTPVELGTAIVDTYSQASASNATLALLDMAELPLLDHRINGFAKVLRANPGSFGTLETLRSGTQTFSTTAHRDLRHFTQRVTAQTSLPALVRSHATLVTNQVTSTVIHNRTRGTAYQNAYGIAIYLPPRSATPAATYRGEGATWSQSTAWDNFLLDF